MRSILTSFYDGVARHPDRLLCAFLDIEGRTTESYTYREFLDRTTDVAAHVRRAAALEPGARVLLAYPPGLEMIAAFFACLRLGLVPVPVYPAAGNGFQAALGKMDFIARDCGASAVLTDRSYYWSVRLNETRHRVATFSARRAAVMRLPWITTTDAERGGRARVEDVHSPIAFLQYTSGSTSDPKGVIVTHENLLANSEAVVDHRPIAVSWLPQYHDMGLIGYYLYCAMRGGTTYGFSPFDFIRRPALWLETISRYRATASSAPNFAFEYCLRPDKVPAETLDGLDLSSLQFLMTAAEPVRAEVVRAFTRKFAPCGLNPESFFSAFGLAEYTLAVTNYGRATRTLDRAALVRHRVEEAAPGAVASELVSCGTPLGTTEVRIVDVDGEVPREAAADAVGEIWLRGPSKCPGYWGRPELSAATFEAHAAGDPAGDPGWLRTGDMGFVMDGELYVCGRLKDMVIVRGQNIYPQDVEATIETDALIRPGCVAAFAADRDDTEALVVVAELRDRNRVPDARQLNQRLREALGVTAASIVFIEARTIPKTSSGKIARHAARRQWEEGALRVVETSEFDSETGPGAPRPGREWLGRFGLTGDETWTLQEAGFDSIRLVEFAHALKGELEANGDRELTNAVDLRVLQRIAVCELIALMDQLADANPLARLRFRKALTDLGEEHRALEAEMMRQDARLRIDTTGLLTNGHGTSGHATNGAHTNGHAANGFGTSGDGANGAHTNGLATNGHGTSGLTGLVAPRAGADEEAIFLTGGTGFFGPFLLKALLEQTDAPLHVLVRAKPEDAMHRLREGLAHVAVEGTPLPEGWEARVRPVCGDLAATRFGLDDAAWRDLADRIGTVYHNGARVNYLMDYAALRDANVGGTNEVVRLAMSRRAKVLNHISTTFIFGWSAKDVLYETDRNAAMERLDFGYSQSKWVSEGVVFDAMARGLDARVFRPALLTPSLGGGGHNLDISIRLLAFMLNHGISTTTQNQVSFSPADLAADNIVAVSRVAESLGHALHVVRDEYATLGDVSAIMQEQTGRPFDYFPLKAFVPELIERCRPGDILFPLLDFLVRSADNISAMEFKRYDNRTFQRFRDASPHGKADPPMEEVVEGILRFLYRQGLVGQGVAAG